MVEYIEREKVLEALEAIGGCGAEPDTWADGYDKAIDEAYRIVRSISAADMEEMQNEAYDLGYQSALRYKGLSWTEAEELQHYRGARMDGDTHE